jgi:D-alanyl-D-alanine carboxypeptidase
MRPRSPRAVFAIALLGAATGLLSAAAAAADAPASERTAADRQLLSSMRDLTAPIGGPPLVIAVLQRGAERKVYRTGVADLARDRRANARQRMRIASTSKAISGGVALSLVAEGTLALDDTIGDWLPDQPISWHGITLRELLNHTSGLPDFTGSQASGRPSPPRRSSRPIRGHCSATWPVSRSTSRPGPTTSTRTRTTSRSG